MKTQWQEIKSIIDFNGISVRFDHYLKAWSEYGPNHIKRVSSKSNFYNTGPTAFDRKEGYKLNHFILNNGMKMLRYFLYGSVMMVCRSGCLNG